MSRKLSRVDFISIVFISLAGELAWAIENQYYNVFLYNVIAPVPFYITLMVAITTITGTLATIFMGTLSDVRGKRKPFVLIGFILWALTIFIFPFAGVFKLVILAVSIAILFDSIMTFFGATAYNAGFEAYVTDITTLENRSKAQSIIQMMSLISIVIVYGTSGIIIEMFGYFALFFLVGGIVGMFGIIGSFLMKESKNLRPLNVSVYTQFKKTFRKENLKGNKNFFLVLTATTIWGIGFNVFFPFVLIYLQHYIKLSMIIASILIFIALIVSVIAAYPLGILTDKIGRKKMSLLSIFFISLFLFLFALFENISLLLITGIFWILFMTSWTIASKTWIKDLYPEENRGQFSGYRNLFEGTFPMVIGPIIGGWLATEYGIPIIINGVPGTIPTPIIFIVGAVIILLTIIPIILAKDLKK
ncbi:MAG: MFS transporter [Promethearchaeota archaeon]